MSDYSRRCAAHSVVSDKHEHEDEIVNNARDVEEGQCSISSGEDVKRVVNDFFFMLIFVGKRNLSCRLLLLSCLRLTSASSLRLHCVFS